MRKEVTVFLICLLALLTDGFSSWQIVHLWQKGEINFGVFYLYGILAFQIILAILIGWLLIFLLKRIYSKGLFN